MYSIPSYKDLQCFTFNGVKHNSSEAIENLCSKLKNSDDVCLRDLAEFLLSWFDNSNHIILQTSGSTGVAKQIKVSKKSMLVSAQKTLSFFKLGEGSTALLCLSPKFIAGKMMIVRAILGKLNLHYVGLSSNPLTNLESSIDFAAMVPAQVQRALLESKTSFNNIAKLIIGGAPVDEGLRDKLCDVRTECWETYGMTETVSHIALRPLNNDSDTLFKTLQGVSICADEKQRLIIDVPDLVNERLVTNDLVEINDKGEFRVLGRYDNIINTGGIKVLPEQVESKLQAFFNRRICVVGLPDVNWGQRVVLVIEDDFYEIDDNTLSHLNKYEKPKQLVFMKAFPLTETGKIKRYAIREMLL